MLAETIQKVKFEIFRGIFLLPVVGMMRKGGAGGEGAFCCRKSTALTICLNCHPTNIDMYWMHARAKLFWHPSKKCHHSEDSQSLTVLHLVENFKSRNLKNWEAQLKRPPKKLHRNVPKFRKTISEVSRTDFEQGLHWGEGVTPPRPPLRSPLFEFFSLSIL